MPVPGTTDAGMQDAGGNTAVINEHSFLRARRYDTHLAGILILVLLLAFATGLRAAREQSLPWLILAAIIAGFGFNIKRPGRSSSSLPSLANTSSGRPGCR